MSENYKNDFPIFERFRREGKYFAYLDSAATVQTPRIVIEAVGQYVETTHANVHRGIYALSEKATVIYEGARETVRSFLNATTSREIIFTRNTTEGINLVASMLAAGGFLKSGDRVLVSRAEHHSNFLPWQALRERGVELDIVDVNEEGVLPLESIRRALASKTKLAAFAHISHVLGTVNPIEKMSEMFRQNGTLFLVDAAQSAAHVPLDVRHIGCDFLVFSGHKIGAPFGIGVLWGRKELLETLPPALRGGGMIHEVTRDQATWEKPPYKFEAGTPNVAGAVALGAAIEYIKGVGWGVIRAIDQECVKRTLDFLGAFPHIRILGSLDARARGGLVSFHIPGIHPHDLATILDEEGVAIRAGHQCAMPLHQYLGIPATTRASFWIYNTPEDVDMLGRGIEKAIRLLKV